MMMTTQAQAAVMYRTAAPFFEAPVNLAAGMARGFSDYNGMIRDIFNAGGMGSWLPDLSLFENSMNNTMDAARRIVTPYRRASFNIPGAQIETIKDFDHLQMLHFKRPGCEDKPKVLLLIPKSGHQAPVLNDTILGLIEHCDIYVSAPVCASMIPNDRGVFGTNAYRRCVLEMMRYFKGDVHVIAVSQAGKPAVEAVSLLHAWHEDAPHSLTLMGCPIDARINPQKINRLTSGKTIEWFRAHALARVESGLPGAGRWVRPGFGLDEAFRSVSNNGYEAPKNMAPADICGEYFIETINEGFIRHTLARGEAVHTDAQGRTHNIEPRKIRRTAIKSIEGELDDIAGPGQTVAVHDLCPALSPSMKSHHRQAGAGHYGIITGKPWFNEVVHKVLDFIALHDKYAFARRGCGREARCVPSAAG